MAKSENVYTVRNADGDERDATAAEFKELKEQGYEKVYKWRRGNEWRQLTATEAERPENSGFKRHGKTPVQETRYLNNGWNDKDRAEEWREAIAGRINDALARAGKAARVDHRSYERQGVDRVPQLHEGSRVRAIELREQRAASSERREYRPATSIRAENIERRRMSAILERAAEARDALSRAIEGAARSAVGSLEREMAQWRERVERARAVLFQPRRMPEKAVSERQAAIYAEQGAKRLRGYRERLMDPSHRRTTGGMRELTDRELSFLTPAQAKAYGRTRDKEARAERAARAGRAQHQQFGRQPSHQQSHNPHRGRGR